MQWHNDQKEWKWDTFFLQLLSEHNHIHINDWKLKLDVKDDPRILLELQDLKWKVLLKAKKIGGLEESFNRMVEDSLTGEVSDEDEVAEIDKDNLHHESIRWFKVGHEPL